MKQIIEPKNCGGCPFLNLEVNYDAVGYDTVATCGILGKIIDVFDYTYDLEPLEPLENCPLKKGDVIVKAFK